SSASDGSAASASAASPPSGRSSRRASKSPASGSSSMRSFTSVQERLELALERLLPHLPDLERQAEAGGRALGGGARRGRRALCEPEHARVMAEVGVAQLGVAVEAELAHDRVLERAGEEV